MSKNVIAEALNWSVTQHGAYKIKLNNQIVVEYHPASGNYCEGVYATQSYGHSNSCYSPALAFPPKSRQQIINGLSFKLGVKEENIANLHLEAV